MGGIQFLFVSLGATIAISIASLLWPKVTSKPSPTVLTQVRHMVVRTPIGHQAADVLGVTDEGQTQPVNVGELAVSAGNAIVSHIEESATQAVASQVVKQVLRQIDKLPENQKLELQQQLCATGSGTQQ